MDRSGRNATSAYIGLGSNLDDPVQQVRRAFDAIAELDGCRLVAKSSLFESTPLNGERQPNYINAAAHIRTDLRARELLDNLHAVEDAHGRDRSADRWASRTLDLDLLLFGTLQCDASELMLPHPGLTQRNFVVYPLAQIAPELVLPDGTEISRLADRLGMAGLRELEGTEIR